MTSRQALWRIFATLPLLLLLGTGCDRVFGLQRDIKDNALRCKCSCAGGGSRNQLVLASSDDAEQLGVTPTMDLLGNATAAGPLGLGTNKVGLRFDRLMIPRRANIVSARVQFVADANDNTDTDLKITAELSGAAPTFTTADNDLTNRTLGVEFVDWLNVPTWSSGAGGASQSTPDLRTLLQEVVNLDDWSNDSAVVLRFEGTGQRAVRSFDQSRTRSPILIVTYDATVSANLPVCASPGIALTAEGRIPPETLVAECARVQTTFTNLAAACSYPTPCSCEVVDVPEQDDSFDTFVCSADCTATEPDATCSNFDPKGFTNCLGQGLSVGQCKEYVSATSVGTDSAVCVASGSPLAFHAFGHRSQCDVSGTADIHFGDHEPTHNPEALGTVEFLQANCPGPDCSVSPYFDLQMDPITFEVRFHSDPTFGDLSASGRAFDTAPLDAGVATFGANSVDGTGNGRRGAGGKAINTPNEDDLDIGLDFIGRACDMTGNVAGSVGDDGICDGDSSVACAQNSDCEDAAVDGPCVLDETMAVDVALAGTLVNQPPTADAGDDETVECTSTAGATFLLDGLGSSDPDGDLALASWRGDARIGSEVSNDLAAVESLAVGASRDFFLRVIDSHAQTDEDDKSVGVVDTAAPVITCNAPTAMRPPSKPVSFTGTAVDVCDASVPPTVTAASCFKVDPKGKVTDKTKSCGLTISGGTLTLSNKAGVGDHVAWTLSSTDDSGNNATQPCEVLIAN